MAQTTNLNVSPYFDDFNSDDNYYKVLFKPGLPVQARELTGLQSILQNQISKFGQHVFKEGAKVIPGNTSYFNDYYCVELNNEYLGVTVESYIDQLIDRKIVGLTSGVTAVITKVLKSTNSERGNLTLYIKYHSSNSSNNEGGLFADGELLAADTDIISGPENSIFVPSGEAFGSTIASNSTSVGASFSISEGVYFIRGNFVSVNTETLIISQYTNNPTGRIGLRVLEETINADEDPSLTDNSKGFNNFAAPGADRLKISCSLFFKDIDDINDNDFVELASVRNGQLRSKPTTSDYNVLGDELARRTFSESGNYTVRPFSVSVKESLNNQTGNNGVFGDGQSTDQGLVANEDLALYQISAGKAFVKGYEIEKIGSTYLDVQKPRTTKLLENQRVNYNTGSTIKLQHVLGSPEIGIGNTVIVSLRSERQGRLSAANIMSAPGEEIGLARIYDFSLESGAYSQTNSSVNQWDLSLYDIQTYTKITLNANHTLSTPTFIEGKFSGATAFLRSAISNTTSLEVYEKSGDFVINEPLIFDGVEDSRVSVAITSFGVSDVRSVFAGTSLTDQNTGDVGFARTFSGDIVQKDQFIFGSAGISGVGTDASNVSISTITSGNDQFPGKLKVGNLLKFGGLNENEKTLARIVTVTDDQVQVTGVTTVTGVVQGKLPPTQGSILEVSDLTLVTSPFQNSEDNTLFTPMPRKFISNVDLSNTTLTIKKSFDVAVDASTDTLTAAVSAGNNETFLPFDDDRYSLLRADGTIEILTDDKFTFSGGNSSLQISNVGTDLTVNQEATLIATLAKIKPSAKIKTKDRVNTLIVDKSKISGSGIGATTLNDGLTFGSYPFGTRVQDKKISVNTPDLTKIIGIFESLDTNDASAPKLTITSLDNQTGKASDLIIGEKIIGSQSNTVAVLTEVLSETQISFVPLNDGQFEDNESISFEESNTTALVSSLDVPSSNVSSNFTFNTGQKGAFYNHGFITRKPEANEPNKRLKIYFENLYFESSDDGDIITANSYDTLDYNFDVQSFGGHRNTDVLDIRPRVSNYTVAESNRSPLEFLGRSFNGSGNSASNILASNESIVTDFSHYLGRIDKVYLTKSGKLTVQQGTPAEKPDAPVPVDDSLEICTITLPPYLFNVSDAALSFLKHKRYRMQDIRKLEERIKNLEYYTALTLLETATANLFISDEDGLNKFKSGFFVDNFTTFLSQENSVKIKNSIDTRNKEVRPSHYTNLIDLQIGPVEGENTIYNGADPEGNNIKKTGTLLSLDYTETPYLQQPFGTRSESVTPFMLNFWRGTLDLTPASDTWVDTVRLEAKIIGVEGNYASTINEAEKTGFDPQTGLTDTIWGSWTQQWTGTETEVSTRDRREVTGTNTSRNQDGDRIDTIQTTTTSTFQDTTTDSFRIGTESRDGSRQLITEVFDQESVGDRTVSTEAIPIMRSRNIAFEGKGFKPSTRLYAFFDGKDVTQHCVPKLLQISMVKGVFRVGETVTGTMGNRPSGRGSRITFRVAVSNHKEGPYNAPTRVYASNPYTSEGGPTILETYSGSPGQIQLSSSGNTSIIPSTYSSTSTTLNVDTISLADQPQGSYYGKVSNRMILKGSESGAEATITDVRLISDFAASIQGSFFIPDPNLVNNDKFETGKRTFTLTDSSTNSINTATTIGEDTYDSTGTLETVQENILSVRNAKIENLQFNEDRSIREFTGTNVTTQFLGTDQTSTIINTEWDDPDPLAQTFFVSESSGIYATSIDVFFETVDDTNTPVLLDIRSVKVGTPTKEVVPFSQVSLDPDQITTSTNGSVATKLNFKSPVYLSPSTEYAICMMSASTKYRVFISRIGENDLITDEFVSNQPVLGTLFKSQNASTWTPSQWEDLKFTLNRAVFETSGSVEIYNPILGEGNAQIPRLLPDSLNFISKKLRLGISSAYSGKANDVFPQIGNTITQQGSNATGNFVGSAGAASGSLTVTRAGLGYTSANASVTSRAAAGHTVAGVALTSITGNGRDAKATVVYKEKAISSATISDGGAGYQVGDVLGITTSLGINGRITVASIGSTSEVIVDNVQGEFAVGTGKTLMYSTTTGGISSAITGAGGGVGANIPSGKITVMSDGLHVTVNHKNHGMHHQNNKVIISGAVSDVPATKLTAAYVNDSTASLSIGSTSEFTTFENVSVASTNPGYIKIRNEIIKYTGFSGNTLTGITRQQDSTLSQTYASGDLVTKYELNSVSLRRINNTHNLGIVTATNPITLDSYKIKLDMGANGIGRSTTTVTDYPPRLFSGSTKSAGGVNIRATQNMSFELITPIVQNVTVPGTTIDATIKTVRGTSLNDGSGQGSDTPFVVKPIENIAINEVNYLDSPRLIAARVNETNNATITVLPGDRSFNMTLNLNTSDTRVSPVIDTERISAILTTNRVGKLISNFATDNRVDSLTDDPSSFQYISKENRLQTSATSIKIILDAHINEYSDLRAFFAVSENEGFEPIFVPFPGFNNLNEKGQVISIDKSDGRSDVLVPLSDASGFVSSDLQYKEYNFSINDLPAFKSFRIKLVGTSTNQAYAPRVTSLKVIALA